MPGTSKAAKAKAARPKADNQRVKKSSRSGLTESENEESTRFIEMRTSILEILIKAQTSKSLKSKEKVFLMMKKLYQEADKKLFAEVFTRILAPVFVSVDTIPGAKLLIKFCQKILFRMDEEVPPGEDEDKNFCLRVHYLSFFCKNHHDVDHLRRLRLVETVTKIFASYSKGLRELDSKLVAGLMNALAESVKDKNADVRAESITALAYLQNIELEQCPVSEILLYHLTHDPNSAVRKSVLENMRITKSDLEFVIISAYDPQEAVRITTFVSMAKVPVEYLTARAMEYLIMAGLLKDKSGPVRRAAEGMVQAWLANLNNNILELLRKFDLTMISQKRAVILMMSALYRFASDSFYESIDWSLFVDKLIPLDNLTEHNAYWWRFLSSKFASTDYAAHMFPSTPELSEYLMKFVNSSQGAQRDMSILEDLLQLLLLIPLEEGGRYLLVDLVRMLCNFPYLQPVHVRFMVRMYYRCRLVETDRDFLKFVRDVMDGCRDNQSSQARDSSEIIEDDVGKDTIAQWKLKAGQLVNERFRLMKELEGFAVGASYTGSEFVKIRIDQCEKMYRALHAKIAQHRRSTELNQSVHQTIEDVNVDNSNNYPHRALELGFTAVIAHIRKLGKSSEDVVEYVEAFRKDALTCTDDDVRCRWLEMETLAAVTTKRMAHQAVLDAATAVCYDSVTRVRQKAIQCIFDLITLYGYTFFNDGPLASFVEKSSLLRRSVIDYEFKEYTPVKNVLMFILGLNDPSFQKLVVLGICKLLLASKMKGRPGLIGTLFSIWVNPKNGNTSMFSDITCWMKNYTRLGFKQACQVVGELIPSCIKIIDSEHDASFKNASVERLIEFVVSHTDQRVLKEVENARMVHVKIAVSLIEEMNRLRTGSAVGNYARMLKTLNLEGIKSSEERYLQLRIRRILKICTTTGVKTSLTAFKKYLSRLEIEDDGTDPANDDPNLSKDIEEDESLAEEIEHISQEISPAFASYQEQLDASFPDPNAGMAFDVEDIPDETEAEKEEIQTENLHDDEYASAESSAEETTEDEDEAEGEGENDYHSDEDMFS